MLVNDQQLTEADKLLHSKALQDSKNPVTTLNLATLHKLQGRFDQSKQLIESIEADDKLYQLALLARAQNNNQLAIRLLTKARIWEKPKLKRALFLLDLYIELRNFREADFVIQQINRHFPSNPLLMLRVAKVELLQGRNIGAKSALSNATTTTGYNPAILYSIASAQTEYGFYKDSSYTLEKALIIEPNNFNLRYLLARTYILSGSMDKARKETDRMLEQYPGSTRAATLLADIDYSTANFDAAAKGYRALLNQADDPELAVSLARTYFNQGKTSQAISFLKQWDKMIPDNATIKWQLAAFLIKTQPAVAHDLFEQLATMLPDDALVFNNLALLSLEKDIDKALSFAEKAFSLKPRDARVVDTYGWTLLIKGNYSEALRYLRDAVARDDSSAEIHYHLGVALDLSDKYEEAVTQLKLALKIGGLDLAILQDAEERLKRLKQETSG